MILPLRRSIIWGSTARQAFNTPIRLVWTISCHDFGDVSTKGPMGPRNGGGAYQDLHRTAELDPHPFQCGAHLFVVAHIGADAQGGAARMLDLQVAQVELGFAARDQPDAGAFSGESDGQAFADSPARTRHQNRDCFERVHHKSR